MMQLQQQWLNLYESFVAMADLHILLLPLATQFSCNETKMLWPNTFLTIFSLRICQTLSYQRKKGSFSRVETSVQVILFLQA